MIGDWRGDGYAGPLTNVVRVTTAEGATYARRFESNTTYYWGISANDGISTSVGPVWHFATTSARWYPIYLPLVLRSQGE